MRRTPSLTLGAALCAAAVVLSSAPASARSPGAVAVRPAVGTAASLVSVRSEAEDSLRAAMLATLEAGATGMITRVDDGDHVVRISVGAARLDPRQRMHTADQVRVGSITKSMVATVALQLVGQGRLRLEDTIEHWLPGLVPGGQQITIRMLLNHTSGVFNYTDDPDFIPTVVSDPYRYWAPAELVGIATSHAPLFPPGTGWSYSNTGYILIGMVLEKVTGAPIQTLLERGVIKPLHLARTFFATSGQFTRAYAHGYIPPSLTGAGYLDASDWPPSWAWAAGAVVSNAADLAKFYQALMSGRLLRPNLLHEMLTTVDTGQGLQYGLGIFRLDTPCGTVWGHDGGIPGYISFAYTVPDGSRSTVVLLPTQADDAIAAAGLPVLGEALCRMLGQAIPGSDASRSTAWHLPTTDTNWIRTPVAGRLAPE